MPSTLTRIVPAPEDGVAPLLVTALPLKGCKASLQFYLNAFVSGVTLSPKNGVMTIPIWVIRGNAFASNIRRLHLWTINTTP
ncbi:MAG: hypothetical protein KJ667_10130 [Alphaproteobacteria bacterium]|nr:hypothetical protein [Alphaproteobacteria bacterium]